MSQFLNSSSQAYVANPTSSGTTRSADWLRFVTRELFVLFAFSLSVSLVLDVQLREAGAPEGNPRFDLVHLLDGTADKPWAFRILVPQAVKLSHALLPEFARNALSNERIVRKINERYWRDYERDGAEVRDLVEKYVLVVLVMYGAYLGLMYVLRALTIDRLGASSAFSNLAPIGFALFLPLTFVNGSYFYDPVELFFIASFVLSLSRHRFLIAVAIAVLATFNKESNLLLPIIFLPLLILNRPRRIAIQQYCLLQAAAACAYVLVRYVASDNAAGIVVFQLPSNLRFWADWHSYFLFFGVYNAVIPAPRGLNVLTVSLLSMLLWWNRKRDWPFWSLLSAATISAPLFLLFCFHDELRNLSFVFIPLYLILVGIVATFWEGSARQKVDEPPT